MLKTSLFKSDESSTDVASKAPCVQSVGGDDSGPLTGD